MTSGAFFERIKTQYTNNLPFVAYRKPNASELNGLLQNNDELYLSEDYTEKGFVFAPFDNSEKSILMPSEFSETLTTVFETSVTDKTSTVNSTATAEDKIFHINLVNQGVEAIKNDVFKKVVLSRKEAVQLRKADPLKILKNLLNTYKSAYVYCWYHPKVGLWLGATPETLIKIEGKRFSIMALAGTQNYQGNLEVTWQEKEIQEQQFVTDFILDHLKPLAESFKASEVETVKTGNLLHLKTMISAQLKDEVSLKSVIDALHPTPAVCGLPKESAKAFILKNENYNREYYTGFLGELNIEKTVAPRSGRRNIENRAYALTKNSTQLYVNLRCMQLKNEQALLYVGGGITKGSDAEKEWLETVSKSLVIKSII
ncbi:chorismate-binding protein [Tamlana sp. 2_MG-2023]|uniref:chorismate-binding protein n=1 Tax=unclassified Tamlana TaxID=2614803 RepID=UPI0026E2CE80|nr:MULTISPECIES: chorismate-binding protein [unclassified Tamlana]MDO6761480.1 chorismate-binding protein [Tamlana sp. 2_MG-2023]MDO6792345.1 chorismate-binding protein [Tamlana sp. 1_MG-2023]